MKLREKIKMHSKKFVIGLVGVVTMLQMQVKTVFADPSSALGTAETSVVTTIKPIVNSVVVPIIDTLLVAATLFAIAKAILAYRKGKEVELGWIIGLIIGIVLVSTFPTWGWQLIPS